MLSHVAYIATLITALCAVAPEAVAEDVPPKDPLVEVQHLPWQTSGAGQVATVAKIDIPQGFEFLGPAGASRFIELNGNPPTADAYIFSAVDFHWFAVFQFDRSGYVRDDETIDAH